MSYLGRTMRKTSDNSVQELARRVNDVLKKIDISQAIAWFAIMGLDIVDTFTPEEYSRAADSLREYHEATGADISAALDLLKARGAK